MSHPFDQVSQWMRGKRMLWAVDELGPRLAKLFSLWERKILTKQELIGKSFEELVFTLDENPKARQIIAAELNKFSPDLAIELARKLEQARTSDGWRWPPVGAIGDFGSNTYRPANDAEIDTYETLSRWLRSRSTGELITNSEHP